MCGIAGILLAPHTDPDRLAAVGRMAATLRHRGPDGGGIWIDRDTGIALGHRRLAIVDLSEAGRQPMLSHGEGLVLTFNGEVYNFAGLRPELEAMGHRFRGHSDSEVMLAAFESFGIDAIRASNLPPPATGAAEAAARRYLAFHNGAIEEPMVRSPCAIAKRAGRSVRSSRARSSGLAPTQAWAQGPK